MSIEIHVAVLSFLPFNSCILAFYTFWDCVKMVVVFLLYQMWGIYLLFTVFGLVMALASGTSVICPLSQFIVSRLYFSHSDVQCKCLKAHIFPRSFPTFLSATEFSVADYNLTPCGVVRRRRRRRRRRWRECSN